MPAARHRNLAAIPTAALNERQALQRTVEHPAFGPCILLEPLPEPPHVDLNTFDRPFAPVTVKPSTLAFGEAIVLMCMAYARARDTLLKAKLVRNTGNGPFVVVQELRAAGLCTLPEHVTDMESIHKFPLVDDNYMTLHQMSSMFSYILPQTRDQRKEQAPRVLVYPNQGFRWDTTDEHIRRRLVHGQVRTKRVGTVTYIHLTDVLDNDIRHRKGWASPHESSIELYARRARQYYARRKRGGSQEVMACIAAAGQYAELLEDARTGIPVARGFQTSVDLNTKIENARHEFYKYADRINTDPDFLVGRGDKDDFFEVLL